MGVCRSSRILIVGGQTELGEAQYTANVFDWHPFEDSLTIS